jgi:hypothetical protein
VSNVLNVLYGTYKKLNAWSSGVAELANASVANSLDLGSNLGMDRKYYLFIFVSHLTSNL